MALNEPIPDEKTPLKALIKVNSISEKVSKLLGSPSFQRILRQ